jgi:hypothetical protein
LLLGRIGEPAAHDIDKSHRAPFREPAGECNARLTAD